MPDDARPRITIPEPDFRPGDEPDFSNVTIPEAGAVTLPPLNVEARRLRNHAFSIIRILRRDGEAVGPWAQMLTDEELNEVLPCRCGGRRRSPSPSSGRCAMAT